MRQLFPACMLFVLMSLPLGQAQANDQEILELAQEVTDQVLSRTASRRSELKAHPERLPEVLGDLVNTYFDFPYLTRQAMGKYARRASASQMSTIEREFARLLVRTYGVAVLNYSGKPIQYERPVRSGKDRNRVRVDSKVTASNGSLVSIKYYLHQVGGKWKVYDVKIDNVSLNTTYRSNFNEEISRGGIDGLISMLKSKNRAG